MIKQLGLVTFAAASLLILAVPTQAKAGAYIGFGVAVAPPVYSYPAYPYAYTNPYYCDPYVPGSCYYPYAYVSPYVGWGGGYWGGRGYRGRYYDGYRGGYVNRGYGRVGGYAYGGSYGYRGGYVNRGYGRAYQGGRGYVGGAHYSSRSYGHR